MGFKLLDVEKFIKDKQAKPVTSEKTLIKKPLGWEPDPNGLYSPHIFGIRSNDKLNKYGYINLKTAVLHPLIYKNLKKIGSIFEKVAKKEKYVVLQNGELQETTESLGKTGLDFLIENWNKINFDKYKKETNTAFIEFLKKIKENLIFDKKIPVIPIIYRPYGTKNGRIEEDEITSKYKNILFELNKHNIASIKNSSDAENLVNDNGLELLNNLFDQASRRSKTDKIQYYVNSLYNYFISKLEKKEGFFRNTFIGKRIDNVARMVANARPDVPVDCVAIPWHVLLNIFDYFVLAMLDKYPEYKKKLGIEDINTSTFGKHIYYIYKNCDIYCKSKPEAQDIWIELLEKIFNEYPHLRVIMKRDPGWSANSFWSLKPIITKGCQYHIVVNSFYYKPLGGDSFNTNILFIKNNKEKIIEKNINGKKVSIKYNLYYETKTLNSIYKDKIKGE